ncbi:MAG: hypothetical protein K2L76_00805 [Muribaculaceae bacterium]|nr:hypothetical protein [Muribaculaceae bacterium]
MKTLLVSLATGRLALRQVPDSALLTRNLPLFLPEGRTDARLRVMPAVRISRLGLAVPEKFAGRYFDSATLTALNVPSLPAEDTDLVADNALVAGEWGEVPDDGRWTVESGDGRRAEWNLADTFVRAVAAVSERSTLKTGDIIALADFTIDVDARTDERVALGLNGRQVLNFKIK